MTSGLWGVFILELLVIDHCKAVHSPMVWDVCSQQNSLHVQQYCPTGAICVNHMNSLCKEYSWLCILMYYNVFADVALLLLACISVLYTYVCVLYNYDIVCLFPGPAVESSCILQGLSPLVLLTTVTLALSFA